MSEVPLPNKVIEVTVLCFLIFISVLGNLSLWLVVLRSKALRTITSMFILGLSTADLLVATVNMPVTVNTIIVGDWTLSRGACLATGYLNMLTLSTSVLSLCNISINRYVMVCHPSKFKDIYTARNSILMMGGVVTLAALVSMPPLFGWSDYVYAHTHSFCFADWVNHMSYAFFMIGCCFCLPCVVMAVCNFMIVKSVRDSRRRVKTHKQTSRHKTAVNNDNATHINIGESKEFKSSVVNINKNKIFNTSDSCSTEVAVNKGCFSQVYLCSANSDRDSEENETCNSENNNANQILHADSTNSTSAKQIRNGDRLNNNDTGHLHPYWKSGDVKSNTAYCDVSTTMTSTNSGKENHQSEMTIDIENSSATGQSSTAPKNTIQRRSTPKFKRREEIRLAFSLVVVILIFIICWLPYCISMILSIFYQGQIAREFHVFTLIIGYANSGCNPIVYGVMNKRFKVGFKRLFCFWKKNEFTDSSS